VKTSSATNVGAEAIDTRYKTRGGVRRLSAHGDAGIADARADSPHKWNKAVSRREYH